MSHTLRLQQSGAPLLTARVSQRGTGIVEVGLAGRIAPVSSHCRGIAWVSANISSVRNESRQPYAGVAW